MNEKKEIDSRTFGTFWGMYDKYVTTFEEKLRPELSSLLAQIEKPSRSEQLFRPEKGWERILAWQVLRDEEFLFPRARVPKWLKEGEILLWQRHWDRDVFVTRTPREELIPHTGFGQYLNPGNFHTVCEVADKEGQELEEIACRTIFADERGLYLPLYEIETVKQLTQIQLEKNKQEILSFLTDEFAYLSKD